MGIGHGLGRGPNSERLTFCVSLSWRTNAVFGRLLIPLDGSLRSELILTQLGRLLHRAEAEIHLLWVLPDVPPSGLRQSGDLKDKCEYADNYLRGLEERFGGRGKRFKTHVLAGAVAPAILDVAQGEKCTLIAMTTHGRTGPGRWIMGSVAEEVARASRIPVLIVRSSRTGAEGASVETSAEEMSFRRILVPTDGSPAARAGEACAARCAKALGSEVVILHSEFPFIPPGPERESFPTPIPTPRLEDPVTERAAEAFEASRIRVTRVTELGDPAGVILDQCAAYRADLIVMGTHGRSGVSRWMLGSVAERVLRSAQVPVLLVRATQTRSGSWDRAARTDLPNEPRA